MKALAASGISRYEQPVRALGDCHRTVKLGLGVCFHARRSASPIVEDTSSTKTGEIGVVVFGYNRTTTAPFDMVVLNDLDRFHLVVDVIDRVPQLAPRASHARQALRDKLIEHKQYIATHGEDLPEIRKWSRRL